VPKKIMTVQLDDTSDVSKVGETSKMSEQKAAEPQVLQRKHTEPSALTPQMVEEKIKQFEPTEPMGPLLSAQEVTKIAVDFLKGLGNKYVMPKRVTKEGDRNYGVEVDMKGRLASILIDRNTKEIMEYEIAETKKEREISSGGGPSSFSPKVIVVVLVIQIALMVVFNFLKFSSINIPFLTGPPAQ